MRQTHISDPDILRIIESSRPKRQHKPISPEVLALLVDSNNPDDSELDSDDSIMQVNQSIMSSDYNYTYNIPAYKYPPLSFHHQNIPIVPN